MKQKVKSESLRGIYRDIADLLGFENAQKLYEAYCGQQISFPVEFYSKEYINNRIIADYDGENLHKLATKYRCSDRTVRRILKEHKK